MYPHNNMKNSFIYILSFILKLLKYTLITSVLVFVVLIILLSNTYKDFQSAYTLGLKGKGQLSQAIAQVKTKNWDEALKSSQNATLSFSETLKNLDKSKNNFIIRNISFFQTQVKDLEYLFKTTEILSRTLERSIPLVSSLDKIRSGAAGENFTNLKEEDKAKFLKLVYESGPELNGLKANLNLALLNINKIHKIGILWPIYDQINEYKFQLQEATALSSNLAPLAKLLPALGGYPNESDLLIILQNNDELRPSGGFIGVFGLAKTRNGDIISLSTNDSYHLDLPAVTNGLKNLLCQ